jgi:hypothetical protein
MELKHTFRTERATDLPWIARISHDLASAAGVAELDQVLHPAHRRPVDRQLPPVTGAAEVELAAGEPHVRAQTHAGELVRRIGHPEARGAIARLGYCS